MTKGLRILVEDEYIGLRDIGIVVLKPDGSIHFHHSSSKTLDEFDLWVEKHREIKDPNGENISSEKDGTKYFEAIKRVIKITPNLHFELRYSAD